MKCGNKSCLIVTYVSVDAIFYPCETPFLTCSFLHFRSCYYHIIHFNSIDDVSHNSVFWHLFILKLRNSEVWFDHSCWKKNDSIFKPHHYYLAYNSWIPLNSMMFSFGSIDRLVFLKVFITVVHVNNECILFLSSPVEYNIFPHIIPHGNNFSVIRIYEPTSLYSLYKYKF